MYQVGVFTLIQFFREHELPSSIFLGTLGMFLFVLFLCRCKQRYQDAPVILPRFYFFDTLAFLRRHYEFP